MDPIFIGNAARPTALRIPSYFEPAGSNASFVAVWGEDLVLQSPVPSGSGFELRLIISGVDLSSPISLSPSIADGIATFTLPGAQSLALLSLGIYRYAVTELIPTADVYTSIQELAVGFFEVHQSELEPQEPAVLDPVSATFVTVRESMVDLLCYGLATPGTSFGGFRVPNIAQHIYLTAVDLIVQGTGSADQVFDLSGPNGPLGLNLLLPAGQRIVSFVFSETARPQLPNGDLLTGLVVSGGNQDQIAEFADMRLHYAVFST